MQRREGRSNLLNDEFLVKMRDVVLLLEYAWLVPKVR